MKTFDFRQVRRYASSEPAYAKIVASLMLYDSAGLRREALFRRIRVYLLTHLPLHLNNYRPYSGRVYSFDVYISQDDYIHTQIIKAGPIIKWVEISVRKSATGNDWVYISATREPRAKPVVKIIDQE